MKHEIYAAQLNSTRRLPVKSIRRLSLNQSEQLREANVNENNSKKAFLKATFYLNALKSRKLIK